MTNIKPTRQMKRPSVIPAEHRHLQIAPFLKTDAGLLSISWKLLMGIVQHEPTVTLPVKALDTIRISKFVWKVHKNVDKKNNDIVKGLKISRHTIGRILHGKLWYKSYVIRRGQFMLAKTKGWSAQIACWASWNIKSLICFGVFSDEKKKNDQAKE